MGSMAAMGAAGLGLGAIGQYEAATDARKMSRLNANYLGIAAGDARRRGDEAIRRLRDETEVIIGQQRAAFAGQGVEVGSGSAADVQADTARLSALDEITIRNNAAREAWGLLEQAKIGKYQGKMQQRAGMMQGFGSLLQGGYMAHSAGMF